LAEATASVETLQREVDEMRGRRRGGGRGRTAEERGLRMARALAQVPEVAQ
jgi:hypothetical protein